MRQGGGGGLMRHGGGKNALQSVSDIMASQMDGDLDDDDIEALQKNMKMLPPGQEPGIEFDDDDEYAQVMGKA